MDHCYQAICRISFSSALHAELFDQLFEFFNIEKKEVSQTFLSYCSRFSWKKILLSMQKREHGSLCCSVQDVWL